jgi:hypothetical protein
MQYEHNEEFTAKWFKKRVNSYIKYLIKWVISKSLEFGSCDMRVKFSFPVSYNCLSAEFCTQKLLCCPAQVAHA